MSGGPPTPGAVLADHGLRPKKHFGQNFLADRRIAARIAELATTPPGGTVVEIGAGLGALTAPLAERAAKVVAIERDRDLLPVLRAAFEAPELAEKVVLVEADAKTVDYGALFREAPRPRVLAGNLPYHLSGPLLERAMGLAGEIDAAVFMLQLEVAERLRAKPATAAYGALSVFAQAAFIVTRAFVVRRGAFHPQPNVDSAVVVLAPRPDRVVEDDAFRAVVHAAFAQRRKALKNAWRGVRGADPETVSRAAKLAGVDLDLRGETLDVEAFRRVAGEIEKAGR